MSHFAVFIGDSAGAEAPLGEALAAKLKALLPDAGEMRWLSEGAVFEIPFRLSSGDALGEIEARLRSALSGAPIDIGLVPAAGRRKRILIADMDSTVIGQECIDELAEIAGVGDEVAAITEASMQGRLDLKQGLLARMRLLGRLDRAAFDQVLKTRISLDPGAEILVATMKAHGAFTALVSSGFTIFTEEVARRAGFDASEGNEAVFENGRLAAAFASPFRGGRAKLEALQRLCAAQGVSREAVLAVGDGSNDREMVQAAGLGVAYHGKEIVRGVADVRIDHGDLTALLYLQGYGRSEFAEAGG